MFSVQTTLEEFENGGSTLKTRQIFTIHTTTEKLESERNNHRSFWICVSRKLSQRNHILVATMSFSQSFVFKITVTQYNATPAFSNFSEFKKSSVFKFPSV